MNGRSKEDRPSSLPQSKGLTGTLDQLDDCKYLKNFVEEGWVLVRPRDPGNVHEKLDELVPDKRWTVGAVLLEHGLQTRPNLEFLITAHSRPLLINYPLSKVDETR
jgi:hypothetical protein